MGGTGEVSSDLFSCGGSGGNVDGGEGGDDNITGLRCGSVVVLGDEVGDDVPGV